MECFLGGYMIIDSSIPYHELELYFNRTGDPVKLTRKPNRKMGSLIISSTLIEFLEGDVDDQVHRYRMYFLSAGG